MSTEAIQSVAAAAFGIACVLGISWMIVRRGWPF
jgi:hypothetical protein